jgi:hypothetical protein
MIVMSVKTRGIAHAVIHPVHGRGSVASASLFTGRAENSLHVIFRQMLNKRLIVQSRLLLKQYAKGVRGGKFRRDSF